MAKKYYAVKQGHKPGIYHTWDECSKQVKGYSGATYKGFSNLEQAEDFLGLTKDTEPPSAEETPLSEAEVVAYVDGSYQDSLKEFSYGAVIFHNGIEEHFTQKYNDPSLVHMRNVAGEIKGAEKAMQFCVDNDYASIDIYYDYEGIEKWLTGEWKTKQDGTKAYKAFYDSVKDKIKIRFIKVAGHSGDKYNDLADKLAKSALGIGTCPDISETANNMTANNIKYDDLTAIFDLLKEDIEDLNITKGNTPYGKCFNLSVNNSCKEKLRVVHFSEKDKIWLQGKKEDLFNQFSLYIIELLETEEVPEFLNAVHNLTIDKDIIESEFDKYLHHAKGKLDDKIDNYLHQAVYNLQINGDMYNATFLVEPAIRPLEAVLKIALKGNDIPIRKDGRKQDSFYVFDKSEEGVYKLNQKYIKQEHSQGLLDYLEKCYNHLYKNRHTLFHWDSPQEVKDTTRILITTTEAHTLIKDTLRIIDDYFKL